MFVGIVETIEIHEEKSDTDDDFEIIDLTKNNKKFLNMNILKTQRSTLNAKKQNMHLLE
jgi:hypothetical protein